MPITIYGIKNCDTMKKARAWLDKRGVEYAFHDYKSAGIERAQLEQWAKKVGWETLLNRAGTTFRKLPDKDKVGLNGKKAIALMLREPSMISGRCSISAVTSSWSVLRRKLIARRLRRAKAPRLFYQCFERIMARSAPPPDAPSPAATQRVLLFRAFR
jgi:arsenate reductase